LKSGFPHAGMIDDFIFLAFFFIACDGYGVNQSLRVLPLRVHWARANEK
jgi:hypothetical protein